MWLCSLFRISQNCVLVWRCDPPSNAYRAIGRILLYSFRTEVPCLAGLGYQVLVSTPSAHEHILPCLKCSSIFQQWSQQWRTPFTLNPFHTLNLFAQEEPVLLMTHLIKTVQPRGNPSILTSTDLKPLLHLQIPSQQHLHYCLIE